MTTQSFGLYNGAEVSIIFGVLELDDMRDDTFLNIRADQNSFETIEGSDGSVTRYATNSTKIYMDFTCMRSSKENTRLSLIHNADRITPGGAGVLPFFVKDPNGTSLLSVAKTWISKMPDASLGKAVGGSVTWPFVGQLKAGSHIIGSNQE